jgi:polypyrimidine tract-binding protein 2
MLNSQCFLCAGLQGLLQYASQLSATQARNTLQGRNIYDGCCTLDIQYSNLQELQVNYNNERTRDYTNVTLPSEQPWQQQHRGSFHAAVNPLWG